MSRFKYRFPPSSKSITLFAFVAQKSSICECNYPSDKTKITSLFDDDIYIDCEENFDEREINLIVLLDIKCVEDFLREPSITRECKDQCIECFRYAKEFKAKHGFEPHNSHLFLMLQKELILIRVLSSGLIKYCMPIKDLNQYTSRAEAAMKSSSHPH